MKNESELYKTMYITLMNGCEKAVRLLADGYHQKKDVTKEALEILIAAQNACEDVYISAGEDEGN